MQRHVYYIKGMVCERCIQSVKEVLENLFVPEAFINLGEVIIEAAVSEEQETALEIQLSSLGFSLLKDKKKELVANTKRLVQEVYSGDFDFPNRFRFSQHAAQKLSKDYDTISVLFSASEKLTVEKYIIDYRIEKIKEFLVYTDHALSHISFALGFSSVAHLSKQFKEQTGLTTSHFRSLRQSKVQTGKNTPAL